MEGIRLMNETQVYSADLDSPESWEDHARYFLTQLVHMNGMRCWEEYGSFLESRIGMPILDILVVDDLSRKIHAMAFFRIEGEDLILDLLSICFDEQQEDDERIVEIATVIDIVRAQVIELRNKNEYPTFKRIVIGPDAGEKVVAACATLTCLYNIDEPNRADIYAMHTYWLQC